jgi:hypothetical protein
MIFWNTWPGVSWNWAQQSYGDIDLDHKVGA